jgi:hypothetical protein
VRQPRCARHPRAAPSSCDTSQSLQQKVRLRHESRAAAARIAQGTRLAAITVTGKFGHGVSIGPAAARRRSNIH